MLSHCRSPDSREWTGRLQIWLAYLPTPPKCSTRAIIALKNNLGIVYHQYCSSSYLDYSIIIRPFLLPPAIEIKFKLDTNKAAKATVAITAMYKLGRVSKGTSPLPTQLPSSSSLQFSRAPDWLGDPSKLLPLTGSQLN
jgi:hypothetical protein